MLKTLEGKGHESSISKTIIKDLRQGFYERSLIPQESIPDLWPKKGKVITYKTKSGDDRKSQHLVIDGQKHFILVQGFIIPTLKTVHSYPTIYPKFIADSGALKFILKGANVMAPGLVNQQSYMDDVKSGTIVSIYVHGHDNALAIGVTTKSTQQIKQSKEGLAVEVIHFIGDGFWNMLYKK